MIQFDQNINIAASFYGGVAGIGTEMKCPLDRFVGKVMLNGPGIGRR
ncbi:MAG TPA: hypothetical protein VKR53_10825 [Puia sp.]|nr:hypothetical protein [Puia sp.]